MFQGARFAPYAGQYASLKKDRATGPGISDPHIDLVPLGQNTFQTSFAPPLKTGSPSLIVPEGSQPTLNRPYLIR